MKHKRGSKKGHKKEKKNKLVVGDDQTSAPISINTGNIDIDQIDDSRHDSEMYSELHSIAADKPSKLSSIEADQPNDSSTGKAGPGRLKVKLKSARALEPQGSYSDIQTPSDTDKSNQQAALELDNAVMEKEDSTYSDGQTSEMKNNISEKLPRKAGYIKIKSSKGLGLSSEIVQDKNLNKLPYRDSRYNEKELSAALVVIKKILKMDAAGPFNAPVDPVALGIPDYFDIIDTPMDFGTICHDLERRHKYMNSEDVFKDVQYIWENCYKYNNKGDYIVDLMKRVKKNFMKYWMAAGLYLVKPSNGATEDGIRPSQDKLYSKGKTKNKRRRHGIDLHKSDCLCAVCVVRRRRKEREENSAVIETPIQMRTSNANLLREFKIEGSSPVMNNCSEDATSSLDRSQETDGNADLEVVDKEEKMEIFEQTDTDQPSKPDAMDSDAMDSEMEQRMNTSASSEPSMHMPFDNENRNASNQHSEEQKLDLGFAAEPSEQKDVVKVHQLDQDEEGKLGDSGNTRSQQHTIVQEITPQQENHSILHICKSLFPRDVSSVWNGPHSLMRCHVSSTRDSPFHTALASYMK